MNKESWLKRVEDARPNFEGVTIPDLLRGQRGKMLMETFSDLLMDFQASHPRFFDIWNIRILADIVDTQQPGAADAVAEYSRTYFLHKPGLVEDIWEVLYCLYQPDVGISRGPAVFQKSFPNLYFEDGLLTHENEGIQFTKDGLLIGGHYVRYSADIGRYRFGLTNGFLAELLMTYRRKPVRYFGLAVDGDALFDRRFYAPTLTEAYMRGPRGLSLEVLQSPSFPEDRKGTVTEHLRIQDSAKAISSWYPVDKLQVKWTYREEVDDGITKIVKTVQMEELVPLASHYFANVDYVMNRYVHAEWEVQSACFRHFDGAVRVYEKSSYPSRLTTDFKHDTRETLRYTKMFRIDADLNIAEWSRLTGLFFDGNELAMEYLGGEQDE